MSADVNALDGAEPPVQLFRLVLTVATHLRTRMDQRLAGLGLTTQQAAVLTVVEGRGDPPTLGQVARALGTSHQNVRQVVAALERKGMARVSADPLDGRVRRVNVTPRVAQVFGERDPADHQEVAGWVSALSTDEQRQVVDLLGRLLAALLEDAGRPT